MTIWADVEPIEGTTSATDVAGLQADRIGALEARVHVLGLQVDDLTRALKRQAVKISAQQVALVRLAKGETLSTGD